MPSLQQKIRKRHSSIPQMQAHTTSPTLCYKYLCKSDPKPNWLFSIPLPHPVSYPSPPYPLWKHHNSLSKFPHLFRNLEN